MGFPHCFQSDKNLVDNHLIDYFPSYSFGDKIVQYFPNPKIILFTLSLKVFKCINFSQDLSLKIDKLSSNFEGIPLIINQNSKLCD